MTLDLPLIWAGLIGFSIIAYVLLDGFDLGIGILSAFVGDAERRDAMVETITPVWDGNQTWLVLGGGGLMAAFPLAYAIVLPALYAPLIAMLLALIFRGVAFEFRFHARRRRLWELGFALGSVVGTLAQGIVLGAFIQGIAVSGRRYAGGWFDWLTWFTALTGVALVAGYALLGATWLVMKTEGPLQAWARRAATWAGGATVAFIGTVSLVTPFLQGQYWQRWFAWPMILYTAPVPLLVAVCVWLLVVGLEKERDRQPFLAAQGLFILCFAGLGISLYPYAVPPTYTIWQAAAPDDSLQFLLIGAAVLLPLILGYTVHSYYVFRGKTSGHGGYE
jgi:cytochrome d ubiquinol oxidase subunit II